MKTARYTTTDKTVTINADNKRDAQEAIQVARAWIRSAGLRSKLVYFYETTSQYSNLVKYYRAEIRMVA